MPCGILPFLSASSFFFTVLSTQKNSGGMTAIINSHLPFSTLHDVFGKHIEMERENISETDPNPE